MNNMIYLHLTYLTDNMQAESESERATIELECLQILKRHRNDQAVLTLELSSHEQELPPACENPKAVNVSLRYESVESFPWHDI